MAEVQVSAAMEEAPPNGKLGELGESDGENTDVIASVTLAEVGSLLKELNVALPALQRVLDRVASDTAGAKRKRVSDTEEESRPAKHVVTSADGRDTVPQHETPTATDFKLLPGTPAQEAETMTPEAETAVPEVPEDTKSPRDGVEAIEDMPGQSESGTNGGADGGVVAKEGRTYETGFSEGAGPPDEHVDQRTPNESAYEVAHRSGTPLQADTHSADASADREGGTNQGRGSFPDNGVRNSVNNDEALLDRTSVILLTLSQLAKVRAGRPPTEVEDNLMAEAYENVYRLASKTLPNELVSKRAIDHTLRSLGLREAEVQERPDEQGDPSEAPEARIPRKVSPSVAALTAFAAQELLAKQTGAPSLTAGGAQPPGARSQITPATGPSYSQTPPSQTPARTPPNVRYGPPLAGQVTPTEAAAIALAAGQGKVLTELDQQLRAAGQQTPWQVGIPTGLPDRKSVQKKIEAHLREQQQLLTQFRQVELIEQHVSGKLAEVQQQLEAYMAQEREVEDQSLAMLREVQLKLSQLRQQSVALQTHQQQLAKAKKTILQKHVTIQTEKQILATAPFLSPRSSVDFPVTCPMCHQQETVTHAIIVCDVCERGYHTRCVLPPQTPPLPNDQEWACPLCKAQAPPAAPSVPARSAVPFQGGRFAGRASPLAVLAASLGASVSTAPGRVFPPAGGAANQGTSSVERSADLLGSRGRQRPAGEGDVSRPLRGDVIRGTPVLEGVVMQRPETPPLLLPAAETHARNGAEARPEEGDGALGTPADVSTALALTSAGPRSLTWVGGGLKQEDGSVLYRECVLNGRHYREGDTVELRSDTTGSPPFLGRIQALWEGTLPGEQRVRVTWCYAPSDIPSEVATPEASGVREVYESNHSDDNPVGSILGPCLLLPQQAFEAELEHRRMAGIGPLFPPLYLCNWSYDARSGKFLMKNQMA
ncbi:FYVE/PHD zinc finger and BAH domain containing protein [Klebsormidium nitens]|uniref:FYVE/PHD zinc finger and BAH domain containing protein n=1 Tax=Klebsormidium nitens TaxID=105231 RepID=A0A1Y1HXI6_KLENI|nr:FYVE/PHD zinc finger and BAH domain containing protein [Klebsormidium nitens]|eukprot:GAQ83355.1 FYVE/PHD zinc finger and BAH domain containing protein [Klebsormidium nitens]